MYYIKGRDKRTHGAEILLISSKTYNCIVLPLTLKHLFDF